jgi:GAF domain-containing protein
MSADDHQLVGDDDARAEELVRVRLENETLSDVVAVVSFSADLEHVLERVVDLLTRASRCHACFIYLVADHQLRLRAASPVYRHLVGRLAFGVDEGLAGWTVRNRTAAFIHDNAKDDPRTNYVPELEEERFQSMVAVPIPSRAGQAIGAVVLHTVAPREFDEGILNVLERAASLVAGAIENAQLYEDARLRVGALTRLSSLAQEIAAVVRRADLYRVATSGVRTLLPCDICRLYEFDAEGQLRLVAADPPSSRSASAVEAGAGVLLDLLDSASGRPDAAQEALIEALELTEPPGAAMAVPLMAGAELLGALVVAAREPWVEHGTEMLRAAAHQVAVSLQRASLIERLTEENVVRDLFEALAAGNLELAAGRARAAGFDLERSHLVIDVRARVGANPSAWAKRAERIEEALRRAIPGAVCDIGPDGLRALLPVPGEKPAAMAPTTRMLDAFAVEYDVVVGTSDARRGAGAARRNLRDAADSARIAQALHNEPIVLPYRDTGAYRYLIGLIDEGGPEDHLQEAVQRIITYDLQRRSQLLTTLETYLEQGRAPAPTARVLMIHVNTLRQRLERIEKLAGLVLSDEDLVAVQLAIKLARVRRVPGTGARDAG